MNAILIKVILIAAGVAMAGLGGWYIVGLIGKNAVLEATVERQVLEVEGYSKALEIVSEKYQIADEVQSNEYKKLSKADFDKMAKTHPDLLQSRINNATSGMLESLESISRGTPSAAKTETP